MLKLQSFTLNPFQENTYLLYDSEGHEAYVIDPGGSNEAECQTVQQALHTQGLRLKGILLTHAHIDHVLGLAALQAAYDPLPPTYLHPLEKPNMDASVLHAESFGLLNYQKGVVNKSFPLPEKESLSLGKHNLQVLHVPGHAPGHVVFYCEEAGILLGGDTLFRESIGRTDLPGGDHEVLLEAIASVLYALPQAVKVYPGHGPMTTIGYEQKHNPFVSI